MEYLKKNVYWLFVIVILVWFIYLGVVLSVNEDLKAGEFGDTFGALNTLFSGLAFAGFLVALFYQRKDLELQKDELRETRKVFEEQQREMKATAEAQTKMYEVTKLDVEIKTLISLTDFYQSWIVRTENRILGKNNGKETPVKLRTGLKKKLKELQDTRRFYYKKLEDKMKEQGHEIFEPQSNILKEEQKEIQEDETVEEEMQTFYQGPKD